MPIVTSDSPRAACPADQAYSKVIWWFMPLLFTCYVVTYLDRANVGFAKLNMFSDLGVGTWRGLRSSLRLVS